MPTPNPTRPYSIPGFRIALVREPGVKLAQRIAWTSRLTELRCGFAKRASKADATGESYYDALVQAEPDRSKLCRPCDVTHV